MLNAGGCDTCYMQEVVIHTCLYTGGCNTGGCDTC